MDYLCKGLQGLPARRKAAGFTQEEFAEALGVMRSALAAWETGRAWPSAAILPQIADLLLCSIDELYRLPDTEPGAGDDPLSNPNVVRLYGGGRVIEQFNTQEGDAP